MDNQIINKSSYDEIERIYQDIKSLIKYSSKGRPTEEQGYKWFISSGEQSWYLSSDGSNLCDRIVKKIIRICGNVDYYECEYLIQEVVQLLLFPDDKETKTVLEENINQLKLSVLQREVFISVFGLGIENDFSFGKIKLRKLELEKYAPHLLKDNDWNEQIKNNSFCWGCMEMKGSELFVDSEAEVNVENHINALTFIYQYLKLKTSSFKHVASTSLTSGRESTVRFSKTKGETGFRSQEQTKNTTHLMNFDNNFCELLKKSEIFNKLDQIYQNDQDTEIVKKIGIGLSYYAEVAYEEREDLQIMKCVIGLESLLSTNDDKDESRTSANLAEKAAFLLSDNYDGRDEIRRLIKYLYDLRSKVGHGSRTEDDEFWAFKAHYYLGWVIAKMIQKYDSATFNSNKHIDEWFLKSKLT